MRMKPGLLLAIVFFGLGCWTLAAQEHVPDAVPPYRLIQVVEPSTLQEKINEAAAEGYRLVGVIPASGGTTVAVLEKSARPQDAYSYLLLAGKGDAALEGSLNEAGTKGFRLVSRDVAPDWSAGIPRPVLAWMEKGSVSPEKFEYVVIGFGPKMALKASLNPKLWTDFNPLDYVKPAIMSAEDRGFRLVRIISGVALIFEKTMVLERDSPSQPKASSAPEQPVTFRTLPNLKGSKLLRKLQEAAAGGYCIVDIDSEAPPLWPAILLDKSEARSAEGEPKPCDYEVIQKRDLGENDFNQAGVRGFRLVPQSLNFYGSFQIARNGRPEVNAIVEKVTSEYLAYEYRSVSTSQLTELLEKLEQSDAEGYRVIKVDSVRGGTVLVIMQKSEKLKGK